MAGGPQCECPVVLALGSRDLLEPVQSVVGVKLFVGIIGVIGPLANDVAGLPWPSAGNHRRGGEAEKDRSNTNSALYIMGEQPRETRVYHESSDSDYDPEQHG